MITEIYEIYILQVIEADKTYVKSISTHLHSKLWTIVNQ